MTLHKNYGIVFLDFLFWVENSSLTRLNFNNSLSIKNLQKCEEADNFMLEKTILMDNVTKKIEKELTLFIFKFLKEGWIFFQKCLKKSIAQKLQNIAEHAWGWFRYCIGHGKGKLKKFLNFVVCASLYKWIKHAIVHKSAHRRLTRKRGKKLVVLK